eukprot:scaffold4492_cov371-Prasinococcus_capsulatus_cf.AAC.5
MIPSSCSCTTVAVDVNSSAGNRTLKAAADNPRAATSRCARGTPTTARAQTDSNLASANATAVAAAPNWSAPS